MIAKRLFDLTVSTVGLLTLWPVMLFAAVGIRLSSPGPILYRARRVGLNGREFIMHKFRTMHDRPQETGSAITCVADPRVSRFGALLRRLKIDELPQLLDVWRGEMSVVGPRPEDPRIVAESYTPAQRETLMMKPGLASPGSIFNYTHGEALLAGDNPETAYVQHLLPVKLALEMVYVRRASLSYDLAIILRTLAVVTQVALGRRQFPPPPEMDEAMCLLTTQAAV